ncbi:MAG TPA: PLP-dependent lyase/thiolase [Candidatus Micrarchaeia archaeon]|nr:PLP-dependent lyase/thiolase [Candidatus Micrarchaeia archaeon]
MRAAVPRPGAAQGQWDHLDLFGLSLSTPGPATLGEGHTPLVPAPRLGRSLGVPDLWLKREELNPTGSHKARSLALQCAALRESGRTGVLSSSGNAAVAAAAYAGANQVQVVVLVSPRTPSIKLRALAAFSGPLLVSSTPVALLRRAVAVFGCEDLRPSVHPLAPVAYRGIAAELERALAPERRPDAVFCCASSGATVIGLADGFAACRPGGGPAIHVVQVGGSGDLVRPWAPPRPAGRPGAIGGLGAGRSRRAGAVRRAVTASSGRGWAVDPSELESTRELASSFGVATSWEGVGVLAAIRAAAPLLTGQRVVALLTGDAGQLDLEPDPDPTRFPRLTGVETEAAFDARLRACGIAPR